MFGSEILDVAIGVVLLFLFISLICTAAMEGTEALLKFRAKDLERGIRELLADPVKASTVLKDFYEHPLIFPLYAGKYDPDRPGKLPSYIPAANFVGAILDLSGKGKLGTSNIADTIRCALGLNENDLEAAKTQLQTWYDARWIAFPAGTSAGHRASCSSSGWRSQWL